MNNKGQTLVIFVIILPILLMALTLIIDLGFLYIEKRNIGNNLYDSVEYYLDNIEEENIDVKVKELLKKNIDDVNININETDSYVEITVLKQRKSIYSIITHDTNIKLTYKGIKESKEIIKG